MVGKNEIVAGQRRQLILHDPQSPLIQRQQNISSLPSATKLRRLCFYRCVSVHRGVCLVWGVCSQGGLLGGGCLLWEGSAPGRVVSQYALRQTPHGRDGYCCGRYASYWNAFLFGCAICKFTRYAAYKNSPLRGWGGLSKNVKKNVKNNNSNVKMSKECTKLAFMHKMSIVKKSKSWTMDDTHNFNC